MSANDIRRYMKQAIQNLRGNVRPGTSSHDIEQELAIELWQEYDIDLPGVIQARREQANTDIAYLSGDDIDTEIDVA